MNTDKTYAEKIAEEYAKKEDSQIVALQKLDHKVKIPALIFGYTFGIFFTLVLGLGMCFAMKKIGPDNNITMIIGIIIGLVGIFGVSINYPIYKKILNHRKEKYAGDIIALAKKVTEEE